MGPVVFEPKKPSKCRRRTLKELQRLRERLSREDTNETRFAEAWIVTRCGNCRACVPH